VNDCFVYPVCALFSLRRLHFRSTRGSYGLRRRLYCSVRKRRRPPSRALRASAWEHYSQFPALPLGWPTSLRDILGPLDAPGKALDGRGHIFHRSSSVVP